MFHYGGCGMINHSEEPNLKKKYSKDGRFLELRANRDIARGKELSFNYGTVWFNKRPLVTMTEYDNIMLHDGNQLRSLNSVQIYFKDHARPALYANQKIKKGSIIEICGTIPVWEDIAIDKNLLGATTKLQKHHTCESPFKCSNVTP